MHDKKQWEDFRKEYEERVVPGCSVRTRKEIRIALNYFEKTLPSKTMRVYAINTGHIDEFISRRREDRGLKKGDEISPATINKDLRHIKAAMAVEWGYLKQLARFRMEKVTKKLPTYVTGEHFAAIYHACDVARRPTGLPYSPADWWRGLLIMAYMTGWRISELLSLKREDLDLDRGLAITRGADNKGKRDEQIKLAPIVIDHLKRLPSFEKVVFPWYSGETMLYREFFKIQKEAGIDLPCPKIHEHTPACHSYGFHDLRRAFATVNAPKLTGDTLQKLMRYKSYSTTQLYINMANQMEEAVSKLHVPDLTPKETRAI